MSAQAEKSNPQRNGVNKSLEIGRLVLRLEAAGMVTRTRDRSDERRVLIAPTDAEQKACRQFLLNQQELLKRPAKLTAFPAGPAVKVAGAADPNQRARENLIHVLFNHNDFVTIR